MSLLSILATAIGPILVIAGVGFALGRLKGTKPDALNAITVYVLAPALVFHSLATSALAGATIVRVVVAVTGFTVVLIGLAELVGRAAGGRDPLLGAFVLGTAFPNVGNYGIPLADFAFGPTGRATAVLVTAIQGVLLYTLGVYVAARGTDSSTLGNLKRVLSVPLVYAVVAALVARWLGVVPPADGTLMTTVGLVGDAAIPVMLLVLGVQLAGVSIAGTARFVSAVVGSRLVVGPVVGLFAVWATALVFGVGDATVAAVVVLLAGTPTAVTTTILVGAFGGHPPEAGGEPIDAGTDDGAPDAETDDGGPVAETEDSAPDTGLRGPTRADQAMSAAVLVTTLVSAVTVTALVAALQADLIPLAPPAVIDGLLALLPAF